MTTTKLNYVSNSIDGGPKLIDETGETVFKSDYPEDILDFCVENGITEVTFDADGNGSDVLIPVQWIGDGEPLELSKRVLNLI